ncbi:21575_t:CDS:2, partial [Cetraspora pellucida]
LQENNANTEQKRKANACIVVLTRNDDLYDIRHSMRQLEDRFNHKYNYPYVFLNNEPFTQGFINVTSAMTKANVSYGLIPKEHWSVPSDIDKERLSISLESPLPRSSELTYHHMCSYDYYWRLEPGVDFYCDIDFDPFVYMKENDIKYGFTLVQYEEFDTIPTLWNTVKEFIKIYPHLITNDSIFDFITNDNGETYNLCQFWSNFEIGDLNLWRSDEYSIFFNFLDEKGGFYYERWGDAPIHTIATALFLKKHQVRYFEEIGYYHHEVINCPQGNEFLSKCDCRP